MSVRVRLTRVGSKKNAIWRVVVADKRSPRDGRFIEQIGHYNPQTEPSTIVIDRERLEHWIARGAQPSETVRKLMRGKPPEPEPAAEPEPGRDEAAEPAEETPAAEETAGAAAAGGDAAGGDTAAEAETAAAVEPDGGEAEASADADSEEAEPAEAG